MLRAALVIMAIALASAACGGSNASPTAGPSPLPSKATFEDGETFVAVRTLPSAALSAEELEAAGTATAPGGARVQFAKATSADVQDWELVSTSPDGWRVWRPQAVLDAIAAAGDGATLVSVERTSWPDSCLGLARPDEVCAQVITTGYRVTVSRGGKQLEYHTDLDGGNGGARLVEQP